MLGVAASTEKPTRAGVRDGRAGRLLPLGVSRGVPSLVGRRVLSGVTSRKHRVRARARARIRVRARARARARGTLTRARATLALALALALTLTSGVTSRDGRARHCAVAPSLAARSLLSLCASCSAPG